MSGAEPVLVLVLPGLASAERSASVASVVAEGVAADRVLELDELEGDLRSQAEQVAFIRVGDRWLPGHLNAHRAAFAATPGAMLSVGRHRRVDPDVGVIGEWGLESESPDLAELALHCPIEASAAVLSTELLAADAELLSGLSQPGAEVALWCDCAGRGPVAVVETVVADVVWDRRRHGFDLSSRIQALWTLARSPVGRTGPAAAPIRRELLARIFLEGSAPPDGFDAAELGGEDGLRGVVTDLQWTLEQQGRQLEAMWRGWPYGAPEREFSRLEWPEDVVAELKATQAVWETERAELNYRLQTLDARVRERNAYIARLSRPGNGTGA